MRLLVSGAPSASHASDTSMPTVLVFAHEQGVPAGRRFPCDRARRITGTITAQVVDIVAGGIQAGVLAGVPAFRAAAVPVLRGPDTPERRRPDPRPRARQSQRLRGRHPQAADVVPAALARIQQELGDRTSFGRQWRHERAGIQRIQPQAVPSACIARGQRHVHLQALTREYRIGRHGVHAQAGQLQVGEDQAGHRRGAEQQGQQQGRVEPT